MNQFKSLPLTAAQLSEDSMNPDVTSNQNLSVDPDFLIDPDFSVPDYDVIVPPLMMILTRIFSHAAILSGPSNLSAH